MFSEPSKKEFKAVMILLNVLIFLFGLSLGVNLYLTYKTESLEKQRDTAILEAVAERNQVYLLEEYIGEDLEE